ncbi:MAG: hypothetical protein QM689_10315 [Oscillospiraceae bacterium]
MKKMMAAILAVSLLLAGCGQKVEKQSSLSSDGGSDSSLSSAGVESVDSQNSGSVPDAKDEAEVDKKLAPKKTTTVLLQSQSSDSGNVSKTDDGSTSNSDSASSTPTVTKPISVVTTEPIKQASGNSPVTTTNSNQNSTHSTTSKSEFSDNGF